ncbi:type VI secretion system ATPase TssH [Vibrio cholerae]|uniref:type VI secretion system ATPase TssH n=1 Tax=Vibrio cholerae TaxID=666 RepID=UPI001A24C854|nr:type VI secretion system ATPase TssH [Vibrio cholerae]EGR4403264.1 type VI secretion system ATPase TssH [Vibrio cholerae]EHE0024380.1 type VI secretion system ATPase TssH [Vibrio cholerae]ELZ1192903.1 type VI secretion system ATPase TssH [Vibrio cholerae]MCX9535755.1 type VI secretion system ATPase TssH [Vibrio cholerae]HAS3380895.1 type VI secretion system ATPase TssH [Vibrio cholerae]
MVNIELQNLIKRLTSELKSTLEAAAGECLVRGHFSIEREHWYVQLLQMPNMGWLRAAQHSGMVPDALMARLSETLVRFARGNDQSPSLSPALVELLKDAWIVASINHTQQEINEYHLLLVLKQRVEQGEYNCVLRGWINELSSEWLKVQAQAVYERTSFSYHEASHSLAQGEVRTPALDKYTRNLTAAARRGELDPVSGRSNEIRKSINILCRRRQNSPILVGDPGVGKTAIVEGLAQQIVAGNVPPSLANVELRSLDLSLLQAGASIKGEFENRLKDIITEIKQSVRPIIMFIDEAHTLIGAGGSAGKNDAANILKPALARGEFRSLAATTWAEYKQYFEADAALTRRFQVVAVGEPSQDEAVQMLCGVKLSLEKHHNVKVMQEAIEAAVALSVRYLPERKLPDKAISLLDTACSRIALSQSGTPHQLESLAEQICYRQNEIDILSHEAALWSLDGSRLEMVKEDLLALQAEHQALELRWQKEKQCVSEILHLQTELDACYARGEDLYQHVLKPKLKEKMVQLHILQGDLPLVMPQVTKQSIADVISAWTGVPVGKMLNQEVERLIHLEAHIGQRVIGQVTPITEIAQAIRLSRAGLIDPRKPIGVFLMCGPSGVGKTETALALTDILYGGEKNITTINMTEFKEEHKVSMLLGAPAGYIGYGKGGVLTEAVRKNPYSVLLLDEMEKAHPSVHDVFYQIFDKGCISDSEGREIDFRNTIIIMTSNAADSAVVNECADVRPTVAELTQRIFPELQHFFKPAFLGRTTIVPYYPLNDEEMAQIARLSLNRIEKRVRQHYGATLSYQEEVIGALIARNQSPETGARAIEQIINRQLMPELANRCIAKMSAGLPIHSISIEHQEGQFIAKIE